ncbi:response regulator [Caulobacter sp. SLTY]|uniref:response regulator n=1 Tax=Caulobacter sp. SLTY TaxID=2683262 RepID=UPI0014135CA7|nr:response regulator [Caulobacter sp. SLTY]
MNVLYVDDEADLRELAQFSLELDPDMRVVTAASGAAALEHLRQAPVDVVLLDVMMPKMDGPTVLTTLRAEIGGAPPVIFVTARALPDERRRLREMGALDVITKPFDPMTLAKTVRTALAGRHDG